MVFTTQGCCKCWFFPLDNQNSKIHQDVLILLFYVATQIKAQPNLGSRLRCICSFVPEEYLKLLALACLSWAMAVQNRAYLIPKHNPTCHSKCLSVVGVCERACSKTALAPGRDPCCCLCGEGGKEGRSWQHWKENGYSSYFCKLPHPILVMKVLQSLPLWRTLVLHILPLGRHLSHI